MLPLRTAALISPRLSLLPHQSHPRPVRSVHASPWLRRGYQLRENLRDCYFLLRVTEDCDDTELREAYLRLAKQYHPDSRSSTADGKKFSQVDTAYKTVLQHRQNIKQEEEKKKKDEDHVDLKHPAAQHRQYLTNEGVGFGTPSERARQYNQYKMQRAIDTVYEYKTGRVAGEYELVTVTRDKQETRKNKIQSSIERLVEDLIAESMARGDFDNLPGAGKPLDYSHHNPLVDTHTHNLNKILINNGYVPEWVTLDREITTGIAHHRKYLLDERQRLGPEPLSTAAAARWRDRVAVFRRGVAEVNVKVTKLNLSCPALHMQRVAYDEEREVGKVVERYREMVARGEVEERVTMTRDVEYVHLDPSQQISMRDVWKEIKAMFVSSKS